MLMVNSFMRLKINDEYNNTGEKRKNRWKTGTVQDYIKYAEGVFDQIICAR